MRTWLHQTLVNYAPLQAIVGDRVYQGENLLSTPQTKPFLVHRLGNSSPVIWTGDPTELIQPEQRYFSIYAHDNKGDYSRLDDTLDLLRLWLPTMAPAPAYRILEVRYLEISRDLDDAAFDTIQKYIRFLAILSR